MRGGPRTPRIYIGKCMIADCNLPIRAKNFCAKHYAKDYYSRQPRDEYSRGRTWVRRNTIAYEMTAVTGIPYKKCLEIIRITLNTIINGVKNGEEVKIPGFGIFGKRNDSPVYFLPAKELKEMVRKPVEVSKL